MEQKKTWVDLHEGEQFTDNTALQKCEQCKDCMFRTVLLLHGNKCERYKNSDCLIFSDRDATGFKPDEIVSGEAECEFYEKGEPIPQEYVPENYISPHNR